MLIPLLLLLHGGCQSSTECGFLRYYCSMEVVGAVLNVDSVNTTAPWELWEQY